ncbi:hypothetical protein EDB19DRAFT_2027698 [Suillus lakei]|nr:hypothetical protein EDB19DRAFT_2027698 [Suillus lakei]
MFLARCIDCELKNFLTLMAAVVTLFEPNNVVQKVRSDDDLRVSQRPQNPSMDGHSSLSAESRMLTTTTSPTWQTTTPLPYSRIPAMSTTSFTVTITLISIVVAPGPSLQPISLVDEQNLESPPTMAAIIGGTVVAVTLLALLLTFIVVRSRRRKPKISITPFNLLSTSAKPPRLEPRVWLGLRSADGLAVRSRSVELGYSDPCLAQDSGDGSPSSPSVPSHGDPISPNDNDESASTVARRQRSYELEKLYPSHARTLDRYRHHSGDNLVEHVVESDYSPEPSEELPAYPRSMESLKSRDADHGDHDLLPSSHPSLP